MSCERFESGESLILEVYAHFGGEFEGLPGIGVSIVRNDGIEVYTTSSTMDQKVLRRVRPEEYLGKVEFRNLPLLSDQYYFNVLITDQENMQVYSLFEKAEPFTITGAGPDFGLVRLAHCWMDAESR